MSKPASIPFFGDAYLADTTHLTTEEHGAYFLLLLAAWRQDDCALPDDDKKLARIAGLSPRKWSAISSTIREFWQVENGRIFQARLRREHDFVCKKSEANRKSAEARWNRQETENKRNGGMRSHSEGNAPPPPPPEVEPKGSPSPPTPRKANGRTRTSTSVDHPLPDDWVPVLGPKTTEMVAKWPEGMLEQQEFRFRRHAETHERKAKNWNAAFAMWLSIADERLSTQGTAYGSGHPHAPRDHRDGFASALDDRLDELAGKPPGEAGRFDFDPGGDDRVVPIAAAHSL